MIECLGEGPLAEAFRRWAAALGEEVLPSPDAGGAPGAGERAPSRGLLHLVSPELGERGFAPRPAAAAERARAAGWPLSLDLTGTLAREPGRSAAFALARLRPALLFATAEDAERLGAPLAGVADVPVVLLAGGGCRVFERRLPPASAGVAAEGPESAGAFTAAFCAAYLEGAPPLEAGARALLLAAQVAAARPVRGGLP